VRGNRREQGSFHPGRSGALQQDLTSAVGCIDCRPKFAHWVTPRKEGPPVISVAFSQVRSAQAGQLSTVLAREILIAMRWR